MKTSYIFLFRRFEWESTELLGNTFVMPVRRTWSYPCLYPSKRYSFIKYIDLFMCFKRNRHRGQIQLLQAVLAQGDTVCRRDVCSINIEDIIMCFVKGLFLLLFVKHSKSTWKPLCYCFQKLLINYIGVGGLGGDGGVLLWVKVELELAMTLAWY